MVRMLSVATISGTLSAFLLPFAEHFRARGWHVDALAQGATDSPECCAAFDRIWDISWSRNPLDPRNLLKAAPAVRRLVERERYDLVHVHTPVAAFVTRYALKSLPACTRPRVVYTAHGFHFHGEGHRLANTLYLGLEKMAGAWTDDLVVINRDDEAAARLQRLLPDDRIHYMPGIGVDLSHYGPAGASASQIAAIRTSMRIPENAPVLVCVAEFIPRKRHRDVLNAFARVEHPTSHLLLPGDGPLQQSMQQLAIDLGIHERVRFPGHCSNIPALILASQALVLASAQEGLPRCVMESLCAEVPVVATDIRGTRELVDESCGMLVRPGDVQGLASAMQWMIDHSRQARTLGQAGRQKMAAFDVNRIIALHESLYRQGLGLRENPVHELLSAAS